MRKNWVGKVYYKHIERFVSISDDSILLKYFFNQNPKFSLISPNFIQKKNLSPDNTAKSLQNNFIRRPNYKKKKRRRKRTRNIENSIFIIIIITFIFSRNLPASCVFPTTKTEKNPHVSSTIDTYQKNNTIFLTTDVHFWNNKNKLHSIERIENDRSSGTYQM